MEPDKKIEITLAEADVLYLYIHGLFNDNEAAHLDAMRDVDGKLLAGRLERPMHHRLKPWDFRDDLQGPDGERR